MSFSRRIRNIEVAADPASGDDVRFILGHYGEDATRIRNAYRREHPTIGKMALPAGRHFPAGERDQVCGCAGSSGER
jgi:hypothetical protein